MPVAVLLLSLIPAACSSGMQQSKYTQCPLTGADMHKGKHLLRSAMIRSREQAVLGPEAPGTFAQRLTRVLSWRTRLQMQRMPVMEATAL